MRTKIRTALALGLPNLGRVLWYRAGVKLGLNPVRRLRASIPDGPFFTPPPLAGGGWGEGAALPAGIALPTRDVPLPGAQTPDASQELPAPLRPDTGQELPAPLRRWWQRQDYFGWFRVDDPAIPHWHRNPFTGAEVPEPMRPWWRIPDFDVRVGDIKTIWEASRFDWVLTFAQHACLGEPEGLERLNAWLADWVAHNPPYRGPNWKCGQEASIRVMHLAVAARLLGQDRRPTPALVGLLVAHLRRIAPTLRYAIAQDNNHGTSEAAALFIGGTWLALLGEPAGSAPSLTAAGLRGEGAGGSRTPPGAGPVVDAAEARRWARLGRKWLENRANRLIMADGSFSQYAVNYHRLMLDTYSLVEHWRRGLELPAFSPRLYDRLAAATRWLQALTQPETGDAPVLGANDGARLLPLGDSDYRDYRPAVQLAMALFLDRCAYGGVAEDRAEQAGAHAGADAEGNGVLAGSAAGRAVSADQAGCESELGQSSQVASWNQPLRWLKIPVPAQAAAPPGSVQCDEGGYSLLRRGPAFALLRYPRFRFRPSQADALQVDLWLGGINHLRDAGSFSYNQGDDWLRYFSGTASHNTIQFDDRDQMPRLSRFLFGDWLRAEAVAPVVETPEVVTAAAGYTDAQGASHQRQVSLSAAGLRVEDQVAGFARRAVLRWRLAPGDWTLEGATVRQRGAATTLRVTASVPIARMELTQGWESRYYLQREAVPVLEVEITQPGRLVSDYTFGPTAADTP